eukprot:5895190-Amphidinium_carterae.1
MHAATWLKIEQHAEVKRKAKVDEPHFTTSILPFHLTNGKAREPTLGFTGLQLGLVMLIDDELHNLC